MIHDIIHFLLFTTSGLIYIIPIRQVLCSETKESNFGIQLSKKWLLGIVVAELILLFFLWIDFYITYEPEVADDFVWHNLIIYYRGIIPAIPILGGIFGPLVDLFGTDQLNFYLSIILYVSALVFDYFSLLIASIIRKFIDSFRD